MGVEAWPLPEGLFVALRTDWSARWPDDAAMQNKDAAGVAHFPARSRPVLRYLYEERKITASGHETTDTNCGIDCSKGDYSLETYILGTDHYQVELLANLDKVPRRARSCGKLPEAEEWIGLSRARVFAILP